MMYDSLTRRLMVGENGLKRRGIWKAGMVGWLVLSACTSLRGGEDDKVAPAALQNEILRAHFRDQFLILHSSREPRRKPSVSSHNFVNRQIKHFLRRVEGRLEILQNSVDDLTEIRRQILEGESDLDSKVRTRWRKRTREISRSAADLRTMLAVIFLQLRSTDDFNPVVNTAENNFLFEVEVRYLNRETEATTRLIHSYLFNATSTVHITDLRHTNMLISLRHIRRMARLLEAKL